MFDFFKRKDEEKNTGVFAQFKQALKNTSNSLVKGVLDIVSGHSEIDEFLLEDIETLLIKADLGVELATEIVESIKDLRVKPADLKEFLKKKFEEILDLSGSSELSYEKDKLNIYFVVGVNGAGKTTLIGRLAHKLKNEGKKVLLAAGDTFRAAAEEQLDIWAKRADVEIIRRDKADSASIVYEAIDYANANAVNVIIVDTAGRLQNKFNLIEELKKIKGVISKRAVDANIESILVLDANLGQNGLSQAKVFNEAVDLTAVALTKLDGSAKGGIIFAVSKDFKIPTKLIGIGEKIEDLKEFDKAEFIEALFE